MGGLTTMRHSSNSILLLMLVLLTGVTGHHHLGEASEIPMLGAKSPDLWADDESGLPVNPDERSNVKVRLAPERTVTAAGQDISLIVSTDQPCHLVVLSFPESGRIMRIWPNTPDAIDAKVSPAAPFRVPGPNAGFTIRTDGSSRSESFVALASTKPESILEPKDFGAAGHSGLMAFSGTKADLVALVAQRLDKLSPSVHWGSASAKVRVASLKETETEEEAVTVTLNVFSGRPNPSWRLNRQQVTELVRRVKSLSAQTRERADDSAPRLGYRGFTIEGITDSSIGERLEIHDNIVDLGDLVPKRGDINHGLEQWLLQTGRDAVPADIRSLVEKEFSVLKQLNKKRLPESIVPPTYEPAQWNKSKIVRQTNNCYNYANDRITLTFAQPGRGRVCEKTAGITCDEIRKAAQCDGLVAIQDPSEVTEGAAVALVIWPNRDYHWYRRDKTGKWSHKAGSTAATEFDQQQRPILDPKTCDRGPYTEFCGYMQAIAGKVRIK